jgi:NADH dehydrogenase
MSDARVLVVGATGQLGSVIVRKLLAAGVPVRALARSEEKLAVLRKAGAEVVAADLLDLKKVTDACRGITQIISTANNNMGKGVTSPMRVDVSAYQNLCAAARNTGVRRLLYVSFRGISSGETVDIFRLKWYIEDAIRRSGLPHVMLRPTAFMDIWVDQILAPGVRAKGVATVFGDGRNVSNYIAVDDVAAFALKILDRSDVQNEIVELGGPSDVSLDDIVGMMERLRGSAIKRRRVPVPVMAVMSKLLRPFNEVTARLISLGHYAATQARPFPAWTKSAERFGVQPRTMEQYLAESWPRLMARPS